MFEEALSGVGQALVADTEKLQLRSVRVAGRFEQIDADSLQDVVNGYAGRSFFDVDVRDIRAKVEARPWIKRAEVKRLWPDGLQITLVEQRPVARWGKNGLLNEQGDVFYPQQHSHGMDALPQLEGVAGREHAMLRRMQEINELLIPIDASVTRLVQDSRGAWRLSLDSGIDLVLGRQSAMQRLQRFVRFYPRLLMDDTVQIVEVDMRYGNGFVVRGLNEERDAV